MNSQTSKSVVSIDVIKILDVSIIISDFIIWENDGRISLNSVLLLLLNFFYSVQVGIDVYIPHCKYQVKLHSSPWFKAACASAIAHSNQFVATKQVFCI